MAICLVGISNGIHLKIGNLLKEMCKCLLMYQACTYQVVCCVPFWDVQVFTYVPGGILYFAYLVQCLI